MELTIIVLVVFPLLMIIRMPISIALAGSVIIAFLIGGMPIEVAANAMYASLNSFVLVAIPFFILVAVIMARGGLIERIFAFSESLVGWAPGGLGAVNIVSSLLFGGISGSATADAAGLGKIEIDGMTKYGYPVNYSAAVTVASSTLAILIPPSIIMVVYAVAVGESVARVLLAGLIPGLVIALVLLAANYLIVRRSAWRPATTPFNLRSVLRTGRDAVASLLAPVIMLWAMATGFATPTEAAALGALYALLLVAVVYRSVSLRDLYDILLETGRVTGVALFLLVSANLIQFVLATEGTPTAAARAISGSTDSTVLLLILILVLLLVIGTFLDGLPMVIILVPVLQPIFVAMGIDLAHAGVIMIAAIGIGLVTPPVGVCLFAVSSVADTTLEKIVQSLWPFYFAMLAALLVLTFVPGLSTWLPNALLN
jgi:C4-dicarboxylate transporter, DctM subunit